MKWKEFKSLHLDLVMKFLKKAECFTRALHDQSTTKVGLLRCGFKRNFTDLPTSRDFPDSLVLYNFYRKNTTSENTVKSRDAEHIIEQSHWKYSYSYLEILKL
ncbi:hypothetical protein C7B79_01940 [Chroococcidiopsis cubana CCALA 043]|nr:hypothetical protein C7B79_01940 [Chroococcidiopsis cubana CCALA 043]